MMILLHSQIDILVPLLTDGSYKKKLQKYGHTGSKY